MHGAEGAPRGSRGGERASAGPGAAEGDGAGRREGGEPAGQGAGPSPQPPLPLTRSLSSLRPQVNEQLAGERSSLAQVLRQEFADRLAASEEENRQVKAELAELRARQRLELEQLTREKQAELEEVHGRWAAGLIGPLGRPEPASGPDAGPRRELAECPPSSFFLSADAEPGPFAVGSMFEDQLFPSLVLGPGPRKKPSHPEPGLVLPCGCREAPWAWVAHVLCRKMEAPEVNSEQPVPRGPLSLSQVPACLPALGGRSARQVHGGVSPSSQWAPS